MICNIFWRFFFFVIIWASEAWVFLSFQRFGKCPAIIWMDRFFYALLFSLSFFQPMIWKFSWGCLMPWLGQEANACSGGGLTWPSSWGEGSWCVCISSCRSWHHWGARELTLGSRSSCRSHAFGWAAGEFHNVTFWEEHQVDSRLFLDVVLPQSVAILQLFTVNHQMLLVSRVPCFSCCVCLVVTFLMGLLDWNSEVVAFPLKVSASVDCWTASLWK